MSPMLQYAVKVAVTAVVVVAVTELGKRSSFWGAALASLPLTSLLAFVWMRRDGAAPEQIASLSTSIFWLVLPSLVLFLALPALLRANQAPRMSSALPIPHGDRSLPDILEDLERQLIHQAYEKANRVKTETARLLGIKTSALYYKLEKYGFIQKGEPQPEE